LEYSFLSSITLFAQDNGDKHDRNQNTNRNNDRNDNSDNRNNQVPDKVQHSFQQDYPNAQNPQWNNSDGQWHGAYKDKDNRDVDAYYNGDGQRIDTHSSYNQNELPERVRDRQIEDIILITNRTVLIVPILNPFSR
jgi:hypothetical protein